MQYSYYTVGKNNNILYCKITSSLVYINISKYLLYLIGYGVLENDIPNYCIYVVTICYILGILKYLVYLSTSISENIENYSNLMYASVYCFGNCRCNCLMLHNYLQQIIHMGDALTVNDTYLKCIDIRKGMRYFKKQFNKNPYCIKWEHKYTDY